MSITAQLQQIPLSVIEAIKEKSQLIENIITYYDKDDIELLELDKSWHLISYILTSSIKMENLPFLVNEVSGEDNLPSINAILCGAPIGKESEYSSYGYLRYLLPEEVKTVSAALSKFSNADIRARFDRAILNQPDIYAVDWEDAETEFELMLEYFEQLVNYYQDAANKANGLLIYF